MAMMAKAMIRAAPRVGVPKKVPRVEKMMEMTKVVKKVVKREVRVSRPSQARREVLSVNEGRLSPFLKHPHFDPLLASSGRIFSNDFQFIKFYFP